MHLLEAASRRKEKQGALLCQSTVFAYRHLKAVQGADREQE